MESHTKRFLRIFLFSSATFLQYLQSSSSSSFSGHTPPFLPSHFFIQGSYLGSFGIFCNRGKRTRERVRRRAGFTAISSIHNTQQSESLSAASSARATLGAQNSDSAANYTLTHYKLRDDAHDDTRPLCGFF